jgi:glycosyltransferase involved in cell wall biosynthesis
MKMQLLSEKNSENASLLSRDIMSFIVLGDSFTFPEGNAATNRVYTYAKGFNENGINVYIICLQNEYLDNFNGVITDGIKYYHPFGQTKRSIYFAIRRWQKFMKYIRTVALLNEINRRDKIIAINIWTLNITTHLFAFVLSKYFKTKIIIERSEHPLRDTERKLLRKIYAKLRLVLESRLYDGIFCISNYLIDFYANQKVHRRKLFLVPSTVDTERFSSHINSPLSFEYILYCGSITILKDGVNFLIESFAKISEKYPEMNLVLIGKANSSADEIFIKNLITKLNIDKRIVLLGPLCRNEIPAYLINAKILALARPESIIADAGFPSKLTEYLTTGNPVIVTKVGEIPLYLRDNENAFLADPGSVSSFANKLDYVLTNYEFAQQVGLNGKELTNSIFNYNFQAKRMISFLSSL